MTVGLLLAGWAAVAGVVLGWGWLLTHPLEQSIGAGDDDFARWLAAERTATLTDAAEVGTLLGETVVGAVVVVLAAATVAVWRRTWLPVVFVVLVEAGLGAIYWLGTHLVPRERPPVEVLDQGLVPDHSFPSGHTGTSMAIFLALAFLAWTYTGVSRGWALLLVLVPLACVSARLYEGAHHLSDVLTTVGYATVWITLVAWLVLSADRRAAPATSGR
ncbi:MAG: phosphatase PAP2 family protein [Nocardioides sp.]